MNSERVSFLVGGAQKAGTTALFSYLNQHSELNMAQPKEVHFFDQDKVFSLGSSGLDWYHKHFKVGDGVKGEVTPIYMFWESVPERVFSYNPMMKWVLILRNPVDRAYSQWNMQYIRGMEKLDFLSALHAEMDCFGGPQCRVRSYIARGMYSCQLERLRRFFPQDQILCVKYEDYKANPLVELNKIFEFIGVSPWGGCEREIHYVFDYKSNIPFDSKFLLLDFFSSEIRSLNKFVSFDLSDWVA